MIGPGSTRPRPPPMPSSDDTRPMLPGTRSRGSRSLMIANASG